MCLFLKASQETVDDSEGEESCFLGSSSDDYVVTFSAGGYFSDSGDPKATFSAVGYFSGSDGPEATFSGSDDYVVTLSAGGYCSGK